MNNMFMNTIVYEHGRPKVFMNRSVYEQLVYEQLVYEQVPEQRSLFMNSCVYGQVVYEHVYEQKCL